MKHELEIKGAIVPNDYAEIYGWYGMECTTPAQVRSAIDAMRPGDSMHVTINSGGGEIASGSAIYSMLREAADVHDITISIIGAAHSAASVIAMAAYCEMSPTALMMVHCVSSMTGGNHKDHEKEAEVLRAADQALSSAYSAKSGMSQADALEMMEHETWLTAQQALERGLIDAVMFEDESAEDQMMVAASGSVWMPTAQQVAAFNEQKQHPLDTTMTITTDDCIIRGTSVIAGNSVSLYPEPADIARAQRHLEGIRACVRKVRAQ